MKTLWALLFFVLTLTIYGQSSFLENQQVYYTVNEVMHHNNGVISLKDQTRWKLNMPLVTYSLKQAIMIRDRYQNLALGYIDGYEYQAKYIGPYDYMTNEATYLKAIAVHPEKNMVLLANNTVWMYDDKEANRIEKIDLPFSVLLDTHKNILVLPMQDTFINVMLVGKDDLKTASSK